MRGSAQHYNSKVYVVSFPLQQEEVRHPLLHPDNNCQRRRQGVLVRRGLRAHLQQRILPQTPLKQVRALDQRFHPAEGGGVWQVLKLQ